MIEFGVGVVVGVVACAALPKVYAWGKKLVQKVKDAFKPKGF